MFFLGKVIMLLISTEICLPTACQAPALGHQEGEGARGRAVCRSCSAKVRLSAAVGRQVLEERGRPWTERARGGDVPLTEKRNLSD